MKIFKTKLKLLQFISVFKNERSIGFVPTMGALHIGHMQLIKKSKEECDITICSIFINPTQFNNTDDYNNYPKTLNQDIKKLIAAGCDAVYAPKIDDIYADGEKAKRFDFGALGSNMEGKFRPGHFNGMATIVEKLFNIINPTKAYFGQKDLQQLQIVKSLVKQINSKIEVIGVQTVREDNGLAISSRNKHLSQSDKNNASLIYKCLLHCFANKQKGIDNLKSYVKDQFKKQNKLKLEYIEVTNLNNLMPIKKWGGENENAICIAAYINSIRLIDNIIL
tara:strand:- start:3108 stop:3944 length:837 start_codon:yes stop_codon:yes gene_type:complete